MKRNFKLRITFYSLITLSILLVTTFLVVYQFDSNNTLAQVKTTQDKTAREEVKLFNKTNSFQIINSKVVGQDLQLSLKNDYDKSINGFYVTVGSKSEYTSYNIELIYSDIREQILPEETFKLPISLEERLYTDGITLRAVVFTDGTADGELNFIEEMKDVRQGEEFQMQKGLELLKNSNSILSKDFSSKLTNLNYNVASFTTSDKRKSPAYNSGLNSGKERLLYYLEKMRKPNTLDKSNAVPELLKLQTKIEKLVQSIDDSSAKGENHDE